jgi:hypothetical protein
MQAKIQILTALIALATVYDAPGQEPARDLRTFALLDDALVTRPTDAPSEQVYYGSDQKLLAAKLADYGEGFPTNVHFPQGALFVLVVSDHVREAFKGLSMIDARHEVVVGLAADKDVNPPKASEKSKKPSRLLLVATAPLEGIKGVAVKTSDGVVHQAKFEELK